MKTLGEMDLVKCFEMDLTVVISGTCWDERLVQHCDKLFAPMGLMSEREVW